MKTKIIFKSKVNSTNLFLFFFFINSFISDNKFNKIIFIIVGEKNQ